MYTNCDITVFSFRDESFERTEIRNVFRTESIDRISTDRGVKRQSVVTVYIPFSSMPDDFTMRVGDMIVKGITQDIPAGADEKSLSGWHRRIREGYVSNTVTAISMHDYGSENMRHIEVVAE